MQEAAIQLKMQQKLESDEDSILGTYKRVNPSLTVPNFYTSICCHERDRKIITRYRVGCHYLQIQAGRLLGNDRDARHCICGNELQTLAHVLFVCPLTAIIRETHDITESESLEGFFSSTNYVRTATVLRAIEKKLNI